MSLYHDFLTNDGKSTHKWLHYFSIYERHLTKFVNQSVTVWEIGVFKGGSLQMWKRFFGPLAQIVGIDISPECKAHEEDQIRVCIGDQSDTKFLQEIIELYGYPDVVIDDGSHIMKDTCATFDFLYDKISKNGVYLVEDMHCSYWDKWDGGLERDGTFIEKCKKLIDLLNARYNDLPNDFASTTFSIAFYDSVVVFDKALYPADLPKGIFSPSPQEVNLLDARAAISRGLYSGDVYLYGIGRHTKLLLENIGNEYVKKITGLLTISSEEEDNSSGNEYLLPICQIKSLKEGDTIIISSIIYQDTIYGRIMPLMERGINIVKLY